MLIVSKRRILLHLALLTLTIGVSSPHAQGAQETKKSEPAPMRLPFALLKPDATIDMAGPVVSGALSAAAESVWVSSRTAGTVMRINPATNAIVATVAAGREPCAGLVGAFGSIWTALCGESGLVRIDAKTHAVITTIKTGAGPGARAIATGVGSIWLITDDKGTVARFDPATNAAVAEIYLAPGTNALAFGQGALWATSARNNTLTRINPYTNVIVETITVGKSPVAVAVGEGAVWTLNQGDGNVSRVDAKTNKVVNTIAVGAVGAGADLAAGEGSVWMSGTGTPLARIDPRTNRVMQQFTGDGGGALAIANGSIWILARPATIWRLDPRRIEATRPQ